jgi:hypothetical protein
MKNLIVGLTLAFVVIAIAFFVRESRIRCHGQPLTREEAVERATSKIQRFSLKFDIGKTPPRLVAETYDANKKMWNFTFHTDACDVIVLADRCEGTDIGGTTGCNPR